MNSESFTKKMEFLITDSLNYYHAYYEKIKVQRKITLKPTYGEVLFFWHGLYHHQTNLSLFYSPRSFNPAAVGLN